MKIKYNNDNLRVNVPKIELDSRHLSDIEKSIGTPRQYLGQPDMIYIEEINKLILVYPVGHGKGPIVLRESMDFGLTWKEKMDVPRSWGNSYETPTIYQLKFRNGERKIILISGLPNWSNNQNGGWQTSISDDDGQSWSEFKLHHSKLANGEQNWSTVAMSSLIQLKNEAGEFIDRWLAVYHNEGFINYKSYLTFDGDGKEIWSEPYPYLNNDVALEKKLQICEVALFRSPDEEYIWALGRTQSHLYPSVKFYSEDEGISWSQPEFVVGALNGERHKVIYSRELQKYIITFREIKLDVNQSTIIEEDDWLAGDWLAWVGTYEDFQNNQPGVCQLLLSKDWTPTVKAGDTGYAGIVELSNDKILTISYGHWDQKFSKNWQGGVTSDLCYIRQARFNLKDVLIENHLLH